MKRGNRDGGSGSSNNSARALAGDRRVNRPHIIHGPFRNPVGDFGDSSPRRLGVIITRSPGRGKAGGQQSRRIMLVPGKRRYPGTGRPAGPQVIPTAHGQRILASARAGGRFSRSVGSRPVIPVIAPERRFFITFQGTLIKIRRGVVFVWPGALVTRGGILYKTRSKGMIRALEPIPSQPESSSRFAALSAGGQRFGTSVAFLPRPRGIEWF